MQRADIVVYGPDGDLRLVVDIRRKLGASAQWIAGLRQNLYQFAVIPHAPYFLLAFPDQIHLWKEDLTVDASARPAYSIPTVSILAPYLGNPPLELEAISSTGLELLIISWLNDLTSGYLPTSQVLLDHPWLIQSGLYAALAGGEVLAETLV